MLHTGVYSTIFFLICHVFINLNFLNEKFYLFAVITFVCHTITDYITSRLSSYFWNKGDRHNTFVVIGWDQFSHIAQLLLTYQLLNN